MNSNSKSLFDFFSSVPDCRNVNHGWKIEYSLAEMLMCLIIGFIQGKTSCFQAWHWCSLNTAYLISVGLVLKNGVASYSQHMRLLKRIDSEIFMLEFMNWMNDIIVLSGVHLALDGKGLRGATQKNRGKKTPYVLNVVETSTNLVIASLPIDIKTNEITAIPQMLSLIAVVGNMITIDAIGTQIEIMEQIFKEQGNFMLLVKKNHPEAYDSLTQYFDQLRSQSEKPDQAPTIDPPDDFEMINWEVEKNHDRMEYRRACVVHINGNKERIIEILGTNSALATSDLEFATVGFIESVRIPIERDENGKDITPSLKEFLANGSRSCPHPKKGDDERCDIQKIGIVSNIRMSASEILHVKREHWSVESMHHVLDVTFAEDYNPAKSSKYNLSLLRKVALNISTLAQVNGDVKDFHSTPVECIHLANDVDLMKKYLFGNLPVITVA